MNLKFKLNGILAIVILLAFSLFGQPLGASNNDRYWVFFADKGSAESLSTIEKEEVVRNRLSEKAIERRLVRAPKSGFKKISIGQDLPVSSDYIEIIKQMGFTIHQKSRWFNGVSGYAPKEVLNRISRLPFVKSVEKVKRFVEKEKIENTTNYIEPLTPEQSFGSFGLDYGPSFTQADFHNIPQLHNQGLTGSGILIGIFDTGFNLDHPALRHLKPAIIAERDFVNNDNVTKNQPGDPSSQHNHGTGTLSVLAGMDEGRLIGVAFNAKYFLAKTEDVDSELHVEEDNWVAAAEWADSLGIDIVSTSLGYSTFDVGADYTPNDMDGETTIITQAANFLADRGVIVVCSAGNEGNNDWHIITAPADGKFVISVGAVNISNNVALFSSRGPTADGRVKPDVVGIGVNVFAAYPPDSSYRYLSGTSLSCPMIAGVCALVLEDSPELTISEMLQIIRQSGDNPNPNNDRGWGKVDGVRALAIAGGGTSEPSNYSVRLLNHNPFINLTTFGVGLPQASPITINIYNILGQKVKTLSYSGISGSAILNRKDWDRRDENGIPVASGIYPFRVHTNFGNIDSKIVIVR